MAGKLSTKLQHPSLLHVLGRLFSYGGNILQADCLRHANEIQQAMAELEHTLTLAPMHAALNSPARLAMNHTNSGTFPSHYGGGDSLHAAAPAGPVFSDCLEVLPPS